MRIPLRGRIRFALYMRGACLFRLGRKEEAEESLRQGAQTAKNPGDRLECLQYLADILAASGKYEKPYRIAAKIFFFVGQYEDAVSVFERARENGGGFRGRSCASMRLRPDGRGSPQRRSTGKLLKDCQALAEELEKEAEPDGQNPDFRDSRPDAIRISPAHKEYRMFLGGILYKERKLPGCPFASRGGPPRRMGDDPAFHYSRGLCLQRLGRKKRASLRKSGGLL